MRAAWSKGPVSSAIQPCTGCFGRASGRGPTSIGPARAEPTGQARTGPSLIGPTRSITMPVARLPSERGAPCCHTKPGASKHASTHTRAGPPQERTHAQARTHASALIHEHTPPPKQTRASSARASTRTQAHSPTRPRGQPQQHTSTHEADASLSSPRAVIRTPGRVPVAAPDRNRPLLTSAPIRVGPRARPANLPQGHLPPQGAY